MRKKQLYQNHSLLARRIWAMVRALERISNPNDEQKAAKRSLEEQALEHEHKAIYQNNFIMIL